jgi:hypothetical protein
VSIGFLFGSFSCWFASVFLLHLKGGACAPVFLIWTVCRCRNMHLKGWVLVHKRVQGRLPFLEETLAVSHWHLKRHLQSATGICQRVQPHLVHAVLNPWLCCPRLWESSMLVL